MEDEYLIDQPTATPTRKLSSGTAWATLVTLGVALLAQFGIMVPEEVGAALVAAIGGIIVVVQFIAGYITKERVQ